MTVQRTLVPSLVGRRRLAWITGAAVLLLTCPACSKSLRATLRPDWKHHKVVEASEQSPQASPQGEAPAAAQSPTGSPQTAPMAYPWTSGASLPTAAAQSPTVRQ